MCIGFYFLKSHVISLATFFFGCFFPLPVLLYCLMLYIKRSSLHKRNYYCNKTNLVHTPEVETLVSLFKEPYREMEFYRIDFYWGGVVIFRRTLLLVLSAFVQEPLSRITLMFLVCVGSLVHHGIVWPYVNDLPNLAEAFCGSALLITAGINIGRGVVDLIQQKPSGPPLTVLGYFDTIDQVLQLWLPLTGISIFIIVALSRLLIKCYKILFCF